MVPIAVMTLVINLLAWWAWTTKNIEPGRASSIRALTIALVVAVIATAVGIACAVPIGMTALAGSGMGLLFAAILTAMAGWIVTYVVACVASFALLPFG